MATRRPKGEGSIFYEAERNRWVGVVQLPPDGSGRRRRTKVFGPTKTEVRRRLREQIRLIESGLPVSSGDMTVEALLQRWLHDVLPARGRVKSVNTVANYRWAVERYLIPTLGTRRLRSLTPDDVERVLRRLATEGRSRHSLVRIRSVLSMALTYAQRRDLVARNAAALAEMPADARSPRTGRSLTVEQAKALLEVSSGDRLGPMITVGLMLGLRPGELAGLRWSDIDLDARLLTVSQSRKRETGADGREQLTFGPTKTAKSVRTLNMPAPVIDALTTQRDRQAEDRTKAGPRWHELDLVFSTRTGGPLGPNNLRRDFSALTHRAGLGHWTLNELRHSAGSLLSAAGVPLEQIADLLGHTDTRMLERIYRHPVRSSVRAAVDPMDRMFGQGL